ncbi:helix-turn-helix transcriptional regulator [Streptomyces sp. SID3343]|uniref:ArsR/SmtB family transcription factor n=1 Tax=Streptomyces sp. SID3343 TaxID=2690260 RepID=UPI00136EF7AD|nr:helix-turn-helix transcriptional regulator [Streptomyces sp. SID3343]MYW06529.1 helix-turn-helix domain-containing protein [Streptomyces sp. SID3343]
MPRPHRHRPALVHVSTADIDVFDVLHALSDPTRMTITRTLRADPERACGTFPVDVAASTLSHHFRVLREAGIIHQREDGNRRLTTLREADLQARFPGLLDAILAAYDGRTGARTEN